MQKIDHRYVIHYFDLKVLSPTNIKAELDSTLGEFAPSFTGIKYWVAEFERGRKSCQDEHSSGRPNKVTTIEIVKKIHKMVLDDCRPTRKKMKCLLLLIAVSCRLGNCD